MAADRPFPSGVREGKAVYTAEEVGAMRAEWERAEHDRVVGQQLAELKGRFDSLPAVIESSARRVFQEMFAQAQQLAAQQAQQATGWRWRRADTIIALGQMLVAAAVFFVAIR